MKKHLFLSVLVGVLCLGVLATAALSFAYVRYKRQVQKLQYQATRIQQNRQLIHMLAAEAVEYSKINPAIVPVLEELGIKGRNQNNFSSPNSNPQ